MIFKIVKQVGRMEDETGTSNKRGNINEKVYPSESIIYESEKARYRKVRIHTHKELEIILSEEMGAGTSSYPYGMPEIGTSDGVEFILISFEDDWTYVVAVPDCSLYIMNNEGHTVDSLHCYNR